MPRAFGVGQRNDAATPPGPSFAGKDQAQLEEIDGSEALFTMYMERAEKEDKEMADRWKADADSILVFSGLFSATVATAIGFVFPDLKPSPQDTTNFYLAGIYHSGTNGSQVTTPLPDPPAFSPPPSAVWINSLWFSSLIISLACALFAIMLQQWARLYLTTFHQRYTLVKEARIREFLAEGVSKFHLAFIAEALRGLHHTSFFLFLAGLAVLLYDTHITVFAVAAVCVGLVIMAYAYCTCVPVLSSNGPYSTPLSPLIWYLTLSSFAIPRFLAWFTYSGIDLTSWRRLEAIYRIRRSQGMRKTVEESAQKFSGELDGRALLWTFKSLSEDQELERFIAGIPSFSSSKAIQDPQRCLVKLGEAGLSEAVISLMHRTLTSNLVSESTKRQRILACTKAIDAAPVLVSSQTLSRVFTEWDQLLGSVDFGRSIFRSLGNDPHTDLCIRCIVSVVLARSQEESGWSNLVIVHLGISDDVLFKYNLGSRNNVLLANLVLVTRLVFRFHSENSRHALFNVSSRTLDELTSNVNVQRASLELQQDFCALWNELVHAAQDGTDANVRSIATEILRRIRKVYVAFHENPDPANPTGFYASTDVRDPDLYRGSSYPLCSVQSHHRRSET